MAERTTMVVALVYITCMYICVTRMPEPESFAPVRSLESSLLIVASYHAPVPSRALSPTNGWFTVLRLLPNAPLYTSRACTSKGPIEPTIVLLLRWGYSCKSKRMFPVRERRLQGNAENRVDSRKERVAAKRNFYQTRGRLFIVSSSAFVRVLRQSGRRVQRVLRGRVVAILGMRGISRCAIKPSLYALKINRSSNHRSRYRIQESLATTVRPNSKTRETIIAHSWRATNNQTFK